MTGSNNTPTNKNLMRAKKMLKELMNGRLRRVELSKKCGYFLSPTTFVSILNFLEGREYVKVDRPSRRQTFIEITERGRAFYRAL